MEKKTIDIPWCGTVKDSLLVLIGIGQFSFGCVIAITNLMHDPIISSIAAISFMTVACIILTRALINWLESIPTFDVEAKRISTFKEYKQWHKGDVR